jgi:hypothetical protein
MAELPPFSRPMDPVAKLQIVAFSPAGYPHTRLVVPEHFVRDIPDVLRRAQRVNPAVDPSALFRTILRLGIAAVVRNCDRHVPIRESDLPHARQLEESVQTDCRAHDINVEPGT